MIDTKALKEFFDVGSFGPLFIFILGVYCVSLFAQKNYSLGVFVIMISFVIYVASNIFLRTHKRYNTYFNEYLDDMGTFLTFGISTIIFGLIYFETNPLFLTIIFFYAIAAILSIARNSILNLKNTSGYPIVLNGIFFPLTYYFYLFYLDAMGSSIFLLFYFIIGFFLISNYNFLSREDKTTTQMQKVIDREIKLVEENNNLNRDDNVENNNVEDDIEELETNREKKEEQENDKTSDDDEKKSERDEEKNEEIDEEKDNNKEEKLKVVKLLEEDLEEKTLKKDEIDRPYVMKKNEKPNSKKKKIKAWLSDIKNNFSKKKNKF